MALDIVRRFVDGAWKTEAAESGGSQPSTQTVTVTTDPNTFAVEHVFDLGDLTLARMAYTVIALTPDGETFGGGIGDIGVGFGAPPQVSADGITYIDGIVTIAHIDDMDPSGYAVAVGQFETFGMPTPRYMKIDIWIFDVTAGNLYAGANHPTCEVRLDVTYL